LLKILACSAENSRLLEYALKDRKRLAMIVLASSINGAASLRARIGDDK
jgi:hypothetical protein